MSLDTDLHPFGGIDCCCGNVLETEPYWKKQVPEVGVGGFIALFGCLPVHSASLLQMEY